MILLGILGAIVIGMLVAPYKSDMFFVFLLFSVITSIINLVSNACMYFEQVVRIEGIEESKAREIIYKEKAVMLTDEFKIWLGEKYPDIERNIFKTLIPTNVSIVATSFPEIKSSEVIMDLVSRINELQSKIYSEKLMIEKYRKGIRIAKRNPWIIKKMIPIA